MMSKTTWAILWAVFLGGTTFVSAQDTADDAKAASELLRDAVDPYVPGKERARFLRAAGVDTELDESEAADNAAASDPFVRPFDKWAAMKPFDRDADTRLNWFEADAYRRAVRKAVVAQYDKDGDGQLKGPEREAANKDLAAGKLPRLDAGGSNAPQARPNPRPDDNPDQPREDRPRRGGGRERFVERYDRDGDGQLSNEERHLAGEEMRIEFRSRFIQKYDDDNDGKLSDAERANALADERDRFIIMIDDLGMKHFDEDGDGLLSDAENRAITEFGMKLETMGKGWESMVLDMDGDGQISGDERRQMQQRGQMAGLILLPKAMKWADVNEDGDVSRDEREAVAERVVAAAKVQITTWTKRFDKDGNGRLDVAERDSLIAGIDEDARGRYKRHDANSDGQLSPAEMATLIEELAGEWGVKPGEQN